MLAIRKILVPTDFSMGAVEALRFALALRRGESAIAPGAAIEVAHALDVNGAARLGGFEGERTSALLRESARERLRAFLREVAGPGEPGIETVVIDGPPRSEIPDRAREFDLVVIGAAGRLTAGELVPGGVAEAVVRRASVPVLTVKWLTSLSALAEGGAFAPREIVFATDFTSFSAQALDVAMAFAFAYGARLTALHVVPDPSALESRARLPFPLAEEIDRFYEKECGWQRDELGRFLRDKMGAERPVEVREVVRAGRAADEIAAECSDRGADLLVMATHGKAGGWKRAILGSVAERALRLAPCPVLTVRPTEG